MVSDARERATSETASPSGGSASYGQLYAELREYVAYFASVQVDQAKYTVKRALLAAVVALVAGVVGICVVLTATVLALAGVASGLGEALGGRWWLGSLITGVGVLVVMALGVWVASRVVRRTWLNRLQKKYETRRDEQRDQFGRDIAGQG